MDGDNVIDQRVLEHPELVVLDLLQHTLGAARRALAAAHPELDDEGDLGPLEDACHWAMLIDIDIGGLLRRLGNYRTSVDMLLAVDHGADSSADLPF
jgi:hypothetical protein